MLTPFGTYHDPPTYNNTSSTSGNLLTVWVCACAVQPQCTLYTLFPQSKNMNMLLVQHNNNISLFHPPLLLHSTVWCSGTINLLLERKQQHGANIREIKLQRRQKKYLHCHYSFMGINFIFNLKYFYFSSWNQYIFKFE